MDQDLGSEPFGDRYVSKCSSTWTLTIRLLNRINALSLNSFSYSFPIKSMHLAIPLKLSQRKIDVFGIYHSNLEKNRNCEHGGCNLPQIDIAHLTEVAICPLYLGSSYYRYEIAHHC